MIFTCRGQEGEIKRRTRAPRSTPSTRESPLNTHVSCLPASVFPSVSLFSGVQVCFHPPLCPAYQLGPRFHFEGFLLCPWASDPPSSLARQDWALSHLVHDIPQSPSACPAPELTGLWLRDDPAGWWAGVQKTLGPATD